MIRTLIVKELREHGPVVLILWGICGLALVGFMHAPGSEISPFVPYRGLVTIIGPLLSLAIVNRLVVREYAGRTQLFLEVLPVTRARVVAVKWVLGAGLTLLPMVMALAASAAWGPGKTLLTARFLALMAARSLGFLLFFYALSFAVGVLGRYRFLAWGLLLVGLMALDKRAQLPMEQWPPLALVADTMALERVVLPTGDLIVTMMTTALLVVGAFVLTLAGEGSLSTVLAKRMTHREKVVVWTIVFLPIALLATLDSRKAKPRYRLEDAIIAERGIVRVGIPRKVRDTDAAARQFVEAIAGDLEDLRDYLQLTDVPPVYVIPDASLDGDVFLRAALPASDGVVVSGALGSKRFEAEEFRAFVVGEVLDWYTRGRASREGQRWLFDGFNYWWVARRLPPLEERLRRRAAAASKKLTPDATDLRRWLTTRERLGDCLGEALAWDMTSALARALGTEVMRDLARDLWGRRPPDDARVLFDRSFEQILSQRTGLTLPDLAEKLSLIAPAASESTSWSASFESRPALGGQYEIHYHLEPGGRNVASYTVRYTTLRPWEGELDTTDLPRVDASHDGVLPLTVLRGTRMFAEIEARDDDLQCAVRIDARRWVVP